jgi:hypothetical protein
METMIALLTLIAGLIVRLVIPVALTTLLIFLLRKLDAHWQSEAQLPQPVMQEIECWKLKNCKPEQRNTCVAYQTALPCWQAKRLPNGYLREECLSCEIFTEAPLPVLKTEPRRL